MIVLTSEFPVLSEVVIASLYGPPATSGVKTMLLPVFAPMVAWLPAGAETSDQLVLFACAGVTANAPLHTAASKSGSLVSALMVTAYPK